METKETRTVSDYPVDVENEQVVLGTLFNFPDQIPLASLSIDHTSFLSTRHQVIAWCIFEMHKRKMNVDEDAFNLVVGDCPINKTFGGIEYLRDISGAYKVQPGNLDLHIDKIKRDSLKHSICTEDFKRLMEIVYDPFSSADSITDLTKSIDKKVREVNTKNQGFKAPAELNQAYYKLLKERKEGKFYRTGYKSLDEHLVEGLKPGLVSVVGGRPGSGKSSVVGNVARRLARDGFGIAIFALEMQDMSIWDRINSIDTGIPLARLIKDVGSLSDDEKKLLYDECRKKENLNLFINDKAVMSLNDIEAELEMLKQRGIHIDIAFIDLFGKINDNQRYSSVADKLEQQLQRVQQMAREMNIHFCLVVQIHRAEASNAKTLKRPTLVGLKNSGGYEEVADIVLLVHRNKYYIETLKDDVLEIHIAKQRQGPVATVFFEFIAETTSIISTTKLPSDYVSAQK